MASITRYDPFGEMVTLRQAMDRLFEDSFVSPLTLRTFNGEAVAPPLDVHQTADEIVVTAALPGIKPDDVDITITGQTSVAFNPVLYPSIPYDPLKDLTPITMATVFANVIIVQPDLPAKTLKELVDYAKAHSGQVNYSSGGTGTGSHFAGAMFVSLAGIAKDVVLVGTMTKFGLWSPERWATIDPERNGDNLGDLMKRVGL